MTFSDQQKRALASDLDRAHVRQREQSGRKLSYIEGWHAIAEANRIFGFDAWFRETLELRVVNEAPRKIGRPPNQRDGYSVSYMARVRVTVGPIVREGVGYGHGIDADIGLAHESAGKEAETDAMKRALMTFGNPFGLALYDKAQAHVSTVAREDADPSAQPRNAARDAEIDAELRRSAQKGMLVLKAAWESLSPNDRAHFDEAKNRVFKPMAIAADRGLEKGETA